MNRHLNIILILVNIISAITLYGIIFHPYFECEWDEKTIEQWNGMWINLSCGIPVSTLFYYLLVYLPDKKKEKNAFKKSIPHLQFIVLRMELFIAYTAKTHNIPVNENDIYYQDILFKINPWIKIDEPEKRFIYYERKNGQLVKTNGFSYDISDLKVHSNIVLDRLNRILSIPYINNDLFNTLISLRDCHLFTVLQDHDLLHKEKNEKMNGKSRVTSATGVIQYYKIYKSLLKFIKPQICYVIKDN